MMVANAAMARPPMKKCWRKEVRMDIGNGVLVVDVRVYKGGLCCASCASCLLKCIHTQYSTRSSTLFSVRNTMRFRVPQLPVLTPENAKTYPEWHAYIKRVYNEPVRVPIDLNTFTWFYYTAPFNVPIRPRRQLPHRRWTEQKPTHDHWLGEVDAVASKPASRQSSWPCR